MKNCRMKTPNNGLKILILIKFKFKFENSKCQIHKYTIMAKPKGQKNTKNKAKHTKLLDRKINKQKAEKVLRKERLKAIIKKAKE